MNQIVKYFTTTGTSTILKHTVGSTGIITNLYVGLPSIMAAVMSSGGNIPTYLILYNIPLIPGYILTGFGFGRYVLIADIVFHNLLYPLLLSTICAPKK